MLGPNGPAKASRAAPASGDTVGDARREEVGVVDPSHAVTNRATAAPAARAPRRIDDILMI
jgi:hypothetical protein